MAGQVLENISPKIMEAVQRACIFFITEGFAHLAFMI